MAIDLQEDTIEIQDTTSSDMRIQGLTRETRLIDIMTPECLMTWRVKSIEAPEGLRVTTFTENTGLMEAMISTDSSTLTSSREKFTMKQEDLKEITQIILIENMTIGDPTVITDTTETTTLWITSQDMVQTIMF